MIAHSLAALTAGAVDQQPGSPPIVGFGAQITLAAFLLVMLVVPWFLAPGRPTTDPAGEPTGAKGAGGGRFTSQLERRYWTWAAVVMVAILATLGPAASVAAWLRARGALRGTMILTVLATVAVLAVPWVRRRPGRTEIGATMGILAVCLTTLVRAPVPEARSHLFEYALVAMLIYGALRERHRNGARVPVPALMAFVATVLLGWGDELLQIAVPGRTYDLVDVGFNTVAAAAGIGAMALVGLARRLDVRRGWTGRDHRHRT